jgi:hypothetical protein
MKNKKIDKTRISYDDWLKRYKGKGVFDITCQENKIFLKQFKSWRIGNIEKVY